MSATNKAAVFGVIGFCFLLSFVAPAYAESESECVAYKRNYDEAIAQKKTPPSPPICDETTAVGPVIGHCVVGTSVCKGEKTAEGKDPSKPDVQVDTSKNSPTGTTPPIDDPNSSTPVFNPDGQKPVPPPGSGKSLLDQMMFDPTPIAEQKTPLSESANSVEDLFKQSDTNSGFVDDIRKKIGNFFSPEPISPTQESFQLQPRDADGNLIPQNPGTSFDPSRNTPDSTFAQPESATEQKDESLCTWGWVCTIKEYGGKALDAVVKEFAGTAEAKPGPVSCADSTVCGSTQKGVASWYNCGTGGDSGPCIGTRNNPISPRDLSMASGYPVNTVVEVCTSSGRCINVVSNDDGGFRGNRNYSGGSRIADLSPAAFERLAPLDQGIIKNMTLNPVAQFPDYQSALQYANSLNQVPVPQGSPIRAAESAITSSASTFYSDYDLPSGQNVTQQFLDASSQQIQGDVLAHANQTFTATQSNPDFSTSGDTGIAAAQLPANPSGTVTRGLDIEQPISSGIVTQGSDLAQPYPVGVVARGLDLEAPTPIDFGAYNDSVGGALDEQTVAEQNFLEAARNIRNAPDDSVTAALDQQEYAASLYDQEKAIADAQLRQDIESAFSDRLALADEQESALEAQVPKPDTSLPTGEAITQQILKSIESQVPVPAAEEGRIPTQEEMISDFVPKPEAAEVTPDQIKEQVRLAQNAAKDEFTVARPADLARIMATPAISGHLSLDMIQKLQSFTNDDEFGTFTNKELEKGIEWSDLPKNAYPIMAQIAKDAGFEAPPFQESNNRESGMEDTVGLSRKLQTLADARIEAEIDTMVRQGRDDNPGPVDGVKFEVNRILSENSAVFLTQEDYAQVADQANFLDNIGSFYAPLNDEPSLASVLDDNNPPIAEEIVADTPPVENPAETTIKAPDNLASDGLTRCGSESCVGEELGDARSRPMSPEEQALQKEIKAAEAQRARLQEQLNKLPENTNVAALIKQAQDGLDAMHSDRKPTTAEARKIENGKAALDQLREIAIGAGDTEMAKELADFRGRLASIDAKAASFAKLAAQNGGEAGAYLTSKGRELVNQLQSGVDAVKAEGPSVLSETRKSDLPGQIRDTRDTITELNSQIATSRQSFSALQSVNTARIPDTWASQSNPSFDPPVVVSDANTSGNAAPTAYVWEPSYPSENLFSTQTEIDALFPSQTAVTQPAIGVDYRNDHEQIVTSANLGSQDAGISKVSEAIDATIKAPAPVVADVPRDIPLSDGPAIPIEGGNERLSVLSDAQVDEKVRTAFDAKTKDAQATVRYAQDLLARSESPSARLAAQAVVDEAQKRLDAVDEASAAYKAGNPSPELQKVIERIRTGDDAGLFSQGLTALSERAHSDAKVIAENIQTSVDITKPSALWEIPKMAWDGGAWAVASGVGLIADSGRNLLEDLGVVGFRANTNRALDGAIDPIGSEWKTVADVAVIAPLGTGVAKSVVGAGVDTAFDVGAAATRSVFGKVTESEVGLLVRDSAGFATTLERDVVVRAAEDVVATETRLPGVQIEGWAMPERPAVIPEVVANDNAGLVIPQAAREASTDLVPATVSTDAEVIAGAAPRGITNQGLQNLERDLGRAVDDINAAPRVEPPAGEVVPAPKTPADVVPEVPITPVVEKPSLYERIFGKREPTPEPVVEDIVPFGEVPEGVRPVVRDFELPRTSEATPPPIPKTEPIPVDRPTLADVVDSGVPGPAPKFDLNPFLNPAPVETAATPKPWWFDSAANWASEHPVKTLGIVGAGISAGTLPFANSNPKGGSSDVSTGGTPPAAGETPPPAGDGGSVPTAVPPPVKTGSPVPPTGEVTKPPVVPPPVKTGQPVVPPPGTIPKPPVVEPKPGPVTPGPVTPRPDNSNTPAPSPTNPQRGAGGGGGIGGMLSSLMGALSNLFKGSQSPQTTPSTPVTPTPVPTTPPTTASSTKPLVTLVANPATIPSARTARLVWSSIGADKCALFSNGIGMGVVSTKGATTTRPLSSTTSFTVRCATAAGVVGSATTTVNVLSGSGSGAASATPAASTEDISASSDTTDTSSNSNTNSGGECDVSWNLVSYANCLLGR